MKQKELLILGEEKLKQHNIQEPHEKAKRLLEFVLSQSAEQLIINALKEVSKEQQQLYETKLQEIIQGKPIQYIVNMQEFMGLRFYVDEHVLIPQPDTEILVEKTIEIIKKEEQKNKEKVDKPISILDLCTGSGAIGISLAKYVYNAKVTLSDISKDALEVAKRNAISNKQEENIEFVCSNLLEKIEKKSFDYIVSNPPYIETSTIKTLPQEVKHEPIIALDGGQDGLEFYRLILKQAPNYLKQNGYLLLEIGYQQGDKVIQIWNNQQNNLELITTTPIKDLGGNDRVLIFQKK